MPGFHIFSNKTKDRKQSETIGPEETTMSQEKQENEPLFHQVKKEISSSLKALFEKDPKYEKIFDNICEPEQVHRWKAVWEDDKGEKHVNTCWRIQQNSAKGPYKGGLRFDPSVSLDVLRFLALEQTFKNALTGKSMGGAKGGSDFNPKGKSDNEIRRFCEAFMFGLHKYIGPDVDVPAGDIGVNSKVIGYLYGYWRKLGHGHVGVLTGKNLNISGSQLRTEATGYGIVYLLLELMKDLENKANEGSYNEKEVLKGKSILISGSGNVATYAAKKVIELNGKLLSLSDRAGTYWCEEGMTEGTVDQIIASKAGNGSIPKNVEFLKDTKPWCVKPNINVDIVIPCATQNEVGEGDAEALVKRGVSILIEGSNLSSTSEAVEVYKKNAKSLEYVGSKLANLGGVGTSFLEMVQNSYKTSWSAEKVDEELHSIMEHAYKAAKDAATEYKLSLSDGANIAAFKLVADAMLEMGYA